MSSSEPSVRPASLWEVGTLFLSFLDQDRARCIAWFVVISIVFFHSLVPPLFVSAIIDFCTRFQPTDSKAPLYLLVSGLGLSWAVASLIRLQGKQTLGAFAIEASSACRVEGFDLLLGRSLQWHAEEQAGAKVQRIQTGSASLQSLMSMMFNSILPVATSIIGPFVAFLFAGAKLFLFAAIYGAIFVVIERSFLKRYRKAQERVATANERASGRLVEGASNVMTIKSLGAEEQLKGSISGTENELKESQLRVRTIGTRMWQAFQIVNGIGLSIFMWMVSTDVLNRHLSIGSVFLFFSYFYQLSGALGESSMVWTSFWEHRINVERMLPLFSDRLQGKGGQLPFPTNWKALEMKRASFAYRGGEERQGIHEMSLSVKRAEKIGIAGLSGSGKSTLAKLLVGVYSLDDGSYQIGNAAVASIKQQALRHSIAIVPQESELFYLSLRDNITLLKEVPDEVLHLAVKIAQLESVIEALPEGLGTIVGEKGYRLSGGERQRVGIARALCRMPEVLILDEATASLDPYTEELIIRALYKSFPELTVVAIAHRHHTLRFSDRILVMAEGRLVEIGRYDELLCDANSLFARLVLESNP